MPQTWDSSNYACHGRFVAELAGALVDDLHPQSGEAILDLGCGDGFLSRKIAESGARVVGVDASPGMIAAARERGIDARLANAESLAFQQEFDAVFSNAALHWMRDQSAVLEGVRRALKPGGRFVAEFGGHGNIAAIRVALLVVLGRRGMAPERIENNFFFTPAEYRAMLEGHGFRVEQIALIPRPTSLPSGMRRWLETFRQGLLAELPADERAQVLDETVDLLRPALCDSEGNWTADYVRLRFRAVRS
jgi:trans-aconitate methyltransferase